MLKQSCEAAKPRWMVLVSWHAQLLRFDQASEAISSGFDSQSPAIICRRSYFEVMSRKYKAFVDEISHEEASGCIETEERGGPWRRHPTELKRTQRHHSSVCQSFLSVNDPVDIMKECHVPRLLF